ncbi:UNVERIFIED_CONTAM: hypothetical protein Cloal_0364 [Acetivibrio alkalicellulosi]
MVFIVTILHVFIFGLLIWMGMKEKDKKVMVISQVLIVISLFYAVNYILEWNIPTVGKVLTFIYEPLSNLVFDTDYSYR